MLAKVFSLFPAQSYEVPDAQWLAAAYREGEFTPDLKYLEKYAWTYLFVCDEMMRGMVKHDLLRQLESRYMGSAVTMYRGVLWKKKEGLSTIAIPLQFSWSNGMDARIKGELWAVRPNLFWEYLDEYKENGLMFFRQRVDLLYHYRLLLRMKDRTRYEGLRDTVSHQGYVTVEKIMPFKAWMYVGNNSFWEKEVDGGFKYAPVKLYQHRNAFINKYYKFTSQEYVDAEPGK